MYLLLTLRDEKTERKNNFRTTRNPVAVAISTSPIMEKVEHRHCLSAHLTLHPVYWQPLNCCRCKDFWPKLMSKCFFRSVLALSKFLELMRCTRYWQCDASVEISPIDKIPLTETAICSFSFFFHFAVWIVSGDLHCLTSLNIEHPILVRVVVLVLLLLNVRLVFVQSLPKWLPLTALYSQLRLGSDSIYTILYPFE